MYCFVMPGHSRSKNGVASLAYVPGIHVLRLYATPKTWMAGTSPAMTTFGKTGDGSQLTPRR